MTQADRVLQRFRGLNVWKRGEERAPHKPLLVLWALGRLQAGADRWVEFADLDQPLTRLLEEFGRPRQSYHPELPFFHLTSDGVWELRGHDGLPTKNKRRSLTKRTLTDHAVEGAFAADVYETLRARPEIVRALAHEMLTAHFPESLHAAIAAAVGLELEACNRSPKRDPAFRREVIAAWGHRCVFCGYSVQLDNADLGLEAAHIQWVQFGGPDAVNNGLACCSLHHQALDRGAVTIGEDYRILVSSRLHGGGQLQEMFVDLHGRELGRPGLRAAMPKREFLQWHGREVFRGAARE